MTAQVLVNTANMDRQEWLEWRRKGIGGSDASAILNLNPYQSAFDVYAEKLGIKEEQPDNEALRQGRDLEDYVAFRFSEATGKKVRRRNAILQHPDYPWMLANVDRLVVGENAGLECKTTSILNKSEFKLGEYPDSYYVQCMHYLAVTGFKKWYLAVLVLNKSFHVFEIERDEEEIEALIQAEKYFWEEHVLKQIPPAFDGSQAASKCLKTMYPVAHDKEVRPLFGMEDKLAEYLELDEQIKELEKQQEKLKQEIQAALETAEEGLANGFKVIWKNRSRTSFDSERFKKEHPDLYKAYLKSPKTYRIFNVKKEA